MLAAAWSVIGCSQPWYQLADLLVVYSFTVLRPLFFPSKALVDDDHPEIIHGRLSLNMFHEKNSEGW